MTWSDSEGGTSGSVAHGRRPPRKLTSRGRATTRTPPGRRRAIAWPSSVARASSSAAASPRKRTTSKRTGSMPNGGEVHLVTTVRSAARPELPSAGLLERRRRRACYFREPIAAQEARRRIPRTTWCRCASTAPTRSVTCGCPRSASWCRRRTGAGWPSRRATTSTSPRFPTLQTKEPPEVSLKEGAVPVLRLSRRGGLRTSAGPTAAGR